MDNAKDAPPKKAPLEGMNAFLAKRVQVFRHR